MFAAARAGSEGGCRALKAVSSVGATSLSDIVCGFHVAGSCIETTSDSTMCLAWRFAVSGWCYLAAPIATQHLCSSVAATVPLCSWLCPAESQIEANSRARSQTAVATLLSARKGWRLHVEIARAIRFGLNLSHRQSQEHSGTVAATDETDFKALKQLQCYQCV